MTVFNTLIVPVFPHESVHGTDLLVANALKLGEWLRVEILFLVPESRARSFRRRYGPGPLRLIPERGRGFVESALSFIDAEPDRLAVCLSTERRGILFRAQGVPWTKEEFLERARVPVVLIPFGRKLHDPPVSSALVPMSGERHASEALDLAIRIGNLNRIPVDLLHVTGARHGQAPSNRLGMVSDQFQHEYPKMVEEFIAEASPYASMEERLVIRGFCHCFGNVLDHLENHVRKSRRSLLIMEWKGALCHGHGQVVRLLMRRMKSPVLLVREEAVARTRLKVGKEFGAAV